ncbi:TolC family protein [Terriglobus tenax]|uniref:TolC family protein n=1 Tax=Terriglobus tenax TaxID=1111115 RepID=UPI0021E0ED86|nr:TolC family protein [Terriglobus tenax]
MTRRTRALRSVISALPLAATLAIGQSATQFPPISNLPDAPSAAQTTFAGVPIGVSTPDVRRLSLDEAIELGMENNLQLVVARQQQRSLHGQVGTALQAITPNMSVSSTASRAKISLAAMGFSPSKAAGLLDAFGIPADSIPSLVKVDTVTAQVNLQQYLFNMPAIEVYRASKSQQQVAALNTASVRGEVVLQVGTTYLGILADAANVANNRSLLKQEEEVLRQARAQHDAGVGTNLDVLRAQSQFQQQQQALISAENALAKDKIALNRLIGLPADQAIELSDVVPYSELSQMSLPDAKALAYQRRKDFLRLQSQLHVYELERRAITYQRLPALSFQGNYGVTGGYLADSIYSGMYHGTFAAMAKLDVPIFAESRFRGDRRIADAQLESLRNQISDLRVGIDQQLRSAMLDVNSTSERVKVAGSNVDLASQALKDTIDRYQAGVDDNLPVIQAEAQLAAAQSQYVTANFQFNQAKLQLARNTGVVETQYKSYLGR